MDRFEIPLTLGKDRFYLFWLSGQLCTDNCFSLILSSGNIFVDTIGSKLSSLSVADEFKLFSYNRACTILCPSS